MPAYACSTSASIALSLNKLFKSCFGLNQVRASEAFCETRVNGTQDAFGIIQFVQFLPEPGEAGSGSQFEHFRMLTPCNLQGFTKTLFCFIDWWVGLSEQQFAPQSKKFC